MIELLTFTRVDEHTSFPKLLDLAHLYPAVEFAVLVGSPTGTGTKPRFPRLAVAHRLRGLGVDHSQNTSIHLCGRFAKEALDPGVRILRCWTCVTASAACRSTSRAGPSRRGGGTERWPP